MSAVIGSGIAAAVFAYLWRHAGDPFWSIVWALLAAGYAVAAAYAGWTLQ